MGISNTLTKKAVLLLAVLMIATAQSLPQFRNSQSHVENLNSTAINSDGTVIATISGYFENIILKVKYFQNGNEINVTQTEIPVSYYFVWQIQITEQGNRILLLSIQSHQVIILERNQFGAYIYNSGNVLQFSEQVSLLDASIDGKLIIVSDYQNFTELYRENPSTRQYELIKTFDTISDYAGLNVFDYFISNIYISKDSQASTILLTNYFFYEITNQTIYNTMVYVKNSVGAYEYQQNIDLDPTFANQIYQSRISNDRLTIYMRGVFGTHMYRRASITATFTNIQNITECWAGSLSSAISDDGSTLYVLCNLGTSKKTLLLFGYKPSLNRYIRIKKIQNLRAQRFYISGDGSKIIFANYRNQSLSYAYFKCNSGQYFVGGECQVCTQLQHLLGKCTSDNLTLTLALCLTIIPIALIIIAVVVIICIRKKMAVHQESGVRATNITLQDFSQPNLKEPRCFVFEEGQIVQPLQPEVRKIGNMTCAICQQDGVTHKINCNHMFHNECIRGWIYRGNDFCPICRQSLQMNDVKQLSQSSSDSNQNKSGDKSNSDDNNLQVKNSKLPRPRKKRPAKQKSIQPNGTTYNQQMLITKNQD